MQKPMLLFDFDGTLANTLPFMVDIYNNIALSYGCKKINVNDVDRLRSMRPQETLKKYGIAWWKLPRIAMRVRGELKQHVTDIELHSKIPDVLKKCKSDGFTLGILTSNSEENCNLVLQKHDLENVFLFIKSGKHIFGKHKILNTLKKIYGNSFVYIGDETRDIEAAKKSSITSIGVTWGFNTASAIEQAQPDHVVNSVLELEQTIRGLSGQ